jgi:hypothetical protein
MCIIIGLNGPDGESHTIVCSVDDAYAGTIAFAPVHMDGSGPCLSRTET